MKLMTTLSALIRNSPPRISPKENGWSKRRIPPQTPPPPLAKSEISRGFAETISPRKMLPQNRVCIVPPPARDLEGRTPKKNVLSTFKKNFTPAKSGKQGTFFFGVAE